jgi:hypothetical protein
VRIGLLIKDGEESAVLLHPSIVLEDPQFWRNYIRQGATPFIGGYTSPRIERV